MDPVLMTRYAESDDIVASPLLLHGRNLLLSTRLGLYRTPLKRAAALKQIGSKGTDSV